jgi:hypothetical protein
MLVIIQANGASLKFDMTMQAFMSTIAAAAPSSWISLINEDLGPLLINTFTIAYIYDEQDQEQYQTLNKPI